MNPTILVVDDHSELREALRRLFTREGFAVAEATNGAEALKFLHSSPDVSLIILDLGMPVMDGWQFLAEWREDSSWSPIPIMVLTGLSTHERLKELGDLIILTKPFQIDDLLSMVRALMKRS